MCLTRMSDKLDRLCFQAIIDKHPESCSGADNFARVENQAQVAISLSFADAIFALFCVFMYCEF